MRQALTPLLSTSNLILHKLMVKTQMTTDPMRAYRAKRDSQRHTVASKYHILGFISSGTYGRVYKAQHREEGKGKGHGHIYAIKKFKPDKEGDVVTYTGISQSAIREIAVRRNAVFVYMDLMKMLAEQRDLT